MTDTNYTAYGILAGNQVIADSGATVIWGDLGSNLSVSGSGTVTASNQTNIGSSISSALLNANNDYNSYIIFTPNTTIATSEVGGSTLTPGITEFSYSGTVTIGNNPGTNVLNFNGNGVYIILVPNGDLTTNASNGTVIINLLNGAKASQIYWAISGSLTLASSGSNTTLWDGTVLCQGNILVDTNSTATGSLCAFSNTSNITLRNNFIISTDAQRPRDITSNYYINIESTLADNEAITISASNTNGGIKIDAGLGGITIDTTNTISLNASAASNFTTSTGNLSLTATTGLTNIDSGSGINLGTTTTPVINIGNQLSTESTNIYSGTGGFNVNTASGGSISLNATGAPSNITQNTTANGQDLTMALQGTTTSRIIIESSGTTTDAIAIQTTQGGIQVTAFGASNSVDISSDYSGSGHARLSGGTGGTGSAIIESGGGGVLIDAFNGGLITIGNQSSADVWIGTAALSKTIITGNNTGTTEQITRFGTNGWLTTQNTETLLNDADTTVTTLNLLSRILTMPATINRTITLPTAAGIIATIPNITVNDSIDFAIINQSTASNAAFITIATGTGGSTIGNITIAPTQNASGSFFTSGSSIFRLRMTNVTTGTETYTVYRIA